jgi:hypothetical protein
MTGHDLRGIFVKSGLLVGVLLQQTRQTLQVLEEVGIGKVAGFDVGQKRRESYKYCCMEQNGSV